MSVELLDFELPTSADPAFTVPVTAEPQAIYLRTKCMTGFIPQAHEYDSWGFWATGTGGTVQCGAGYQFVDNSVSDNPHSKCNELDILVLEDNAGATLNVRVTAVSATEITLNVSGTLLASGIRVMGFAMSGIQDAWCGAYQVSAYPIQFNSGFEPDFALMSQIGCRPDDTVFSSTNSAVLNFGAMNATNQACVNRYTDSTQVANAATSASELDLSWWMNRDQLLEQWYGTFNATGLDVSSRAGTNYTSSVQTLIALLLKGVESTIETGTTVSGSIPHSFTHTPKVMILTGSGNTVWETRQNNAGTTAWPQTSQAIAVPGTPPTTASMHTGGDSDTAGRRKHRNNEDGACWGRVAGSQADNSIPQYRGEITSFDAQAAETTWTLDGTGAPTGAYPFFLVAFNAIAQVPDAQIDLNTATIIGNIGDVPMELLPESVSQGGYASFGPGVFR